MVAALTALALIIALLLTIFVPDTGNGFRPQANPNFRPPATPPAGFSGGRERGTPFFPFIEELTGFWRYVAQLVSTLGVGLLILFFLPRTIAESASLLRRDWRLLLRAFLVGLIGIAVVVALVVLAASSLVGIAIAGFGAVILLPFALIGMTVMALAIGRTLAAALLHEITPQPLTDLFSGLLIAFILLIIPYLGFWLFIVLVAAGNGALLLRRQDDNRTAFDEMEY